MDAAERSPYTGYTREHWTAAADRLLAAVRPYASPDHARIDLPGRTSRYGRDSDALEGFARTFLLAAIRLRGEGGADPDGLAGWYADGLRAGPDVWPRPDRLDQAKVEAASIALGLHLSRPWIWDRLDDAGRERIAGWLGTVVGQAYPPINWVWFQLTVEAFLRGAGGDWSEADIHSGLAAHESLYRGDGWYADGPERSYDHYNGWALHTFPLLWADLAGDLCPEHLRQAWRERLRRFLGDAVHLVGADGSPLLQGRSLIYRFGAAAPFWMGAVTGATPLSPGATRRACSGILRHFHQHGVPGRRGLLTLGWHREWPAMAQSYSGPGSPYWAVKGMLGLLLPADHPVWTDVEEPLPVERSDFTRAIGPPGWLAAGTRADGVVRVANHGTDHALEGDGGTDAPLYARLGYSTATFPAGDDNAIALVRDGEPSHRSGFRTVGCTTDGAVSVARLHWVGTPDTAAPDHGSGRTGTVTWGPHMTMASLIRGAVEVRVARIDDEVDDEEPAPGTVLEFSGWPITRGLTSLLVPLHGFEGAALSERTVASPLGDEVRVPVLRAAEPPRAGRVYAVAVRLSRAPSGGLPTVTAAAGTVTVHWPDGSTATVTLPAVARRSPG
ncbi:DUF2264 domain-containing protein [Dactylosporangium sp. NPDC006015]|uniref:DUF2264 domain-containing protein n=1 Tax=Dactylosporangium sp. NPDC006015 TaxID=3154576 RepID=UPI0033A64322